ncbi:Lrp/AsnC family transcriptional regulator [Rhizobium halophytocola]|uniref:DNA-binding Lrp family transcriptional regulator n=1 Tax=Rhizobium halophytocola TaxID=735519 RepID=A0ABS4DV85_9HYPH|nr:Lrp/AsnC family transcriptional regulator [Rhizobium halophytocola]MBP1849596.1 DNA-binding Lrp family transcriptional regulator [Rhizobium halophytocola]
MNSVDRKIIRLLETDARISFAELAEAVGLSKTPCWNRVKALEAAGLIRGYFAAIDPVKLGFGVEALVQVTIDPERFEAFERGVRAHPLVRRAHATTGEADYLLHIMAADMGALDTLLRLEISQLAGVRRTVTAMITREIKAENSMADAHQHAGL